MTIREHYVVFLATDNTPFSQDNTTPVLYESVGLEQDRTKAFSHLDDMIRVFISKNLTSSNRHVVLLSRQERSRSRSSFG